MENPLYKLFTRTGCAMCPFQSDRAWFQVWKHYPDTWEYVKWIEKRLAYYESRGMKVANRFWFTKYRTCEQMEKQFMRDDNAMFFDDEPVKDCLCAI
jgi:3'-phosphoadenosine 5'-phosphosulfate sulfotransferase (PAPS reductase)/FAD synthetase